MTPRRLPPKLLEAARRQGVDLTRHVLWIRVGRQELIHFELDATGEVSSSRRMPASTSRFGIGQQENSNRTPLGLHRIAKRIGRGLPPGAVLKGRVYQGYVWNGQPGDTITSRILWLEGLEPGFNRGGNVDSFKRYIYIHGTGDQTTLGKPMTCGCTHLSDRDLLPLFNTVRVGTLVWISAL